MAVKIKFDYCHNPIMPTLAIANKSGEKLGILPANSMKFSHKLNTYNEMSFRVYKDIVDDDALWDEIKDFMLLWVSDWDLWFELTVTLSETDTSVKNVIAKSLGEAELSQVNVYDISVNTEDDISRDGYIPTVIYDSVNADISLLDKILSFAPHYKIKSVASSIVNLNRSFEFKGVTVYDALQKVSADINCLFDYSVHSDENGKPDRQIKVYDLESYCFECGHRGDFLEECEKCHSTNIKAGYGEDSRIIVSTSSLAENIEYKADAPSVKNCFKLEAGDDTMNAAIASCNPNGSNHIWYIPEKTRADMPDELANKVKAYDDLCAYYNNVHSVNVDSTKLTAYNSLAGKYGKETIPGTITGFPALMDYYTSIVDFKDYLKKSFMPTVETSAQAEAAFLSNNLSIVGVDNVSSISGDSVNNAVLAVAQTMVNNQCSVKLKSGTYNANIYQWSGTFDVEYKGEKSTTGSIYVTLTDSDECRILQAAQKEIFTSSGDISNAVSIFNMDDTGFNVAIAGYSVSGLNALIDCCAGALNVMIENGAGNADVWATAPENLYTALYQPYNAKHTALKNELNLRKSEIQMMTDLQDAFDDVIADIQMVLNFKTHMGDMWLDFIAYRREDVFSNTNYKSDGLTNAEIMSRARLFIDTAQKELYRAATLQHSITSTLKNLLVMPEFDGLTDYFAIGNWIHVICDDGVHDLRLLSYDIDFDNLNNLTVTFSDVRESDDRCLYLEDVIKQSASMATSYDSVSKQAEKGNDSRNRLDGWAENGLSLTAMKIINNADNQDYVFDSHGMIFRKYLPLSDTYHDEQLKIINSTIAITNDGWDTVKTAIGSLNYIDPLTNEIKHGYGINGEVIIGKLLLGESLGIYNSGATMQFNKNGLTVTNDDYSFEVTPNGNTLMRLYSPTEDLFTLTNKGDLSITGCINATSGTIGGCDIINNTLTIDAAHITSGVLDKARIPYLSADKVNVSEIITVGGIALADDIPTTDEITTITKDTIKTTNVTASNLKVKAANIDGTLTIGQLPSSVATTDDIPTDEEITTITNNTIKTTNVTAANLTVKAANISGTLTASQINGDGLDVSNANIGNMTITNKLYFGGDIQYYIDANYNDNSYYINLPGFKVDERSGAVFSGTLSAASGSFNGEITASSGTIGGWAIEGEILHATVGVYGTYSYSTTGTDLKYATGYAFASLSPDGIYYIIRESNDWSSTIIAIISLLGTSGSSSGGGTIQPL